MKSFRERQIPSDFTHKRNLRYRTDELRGGKEKENRLKTERETNDQRPLPTENKLRVAGGEVGGGTG